MTSTLASALHEAGLITTNDTEFAAGLREHPSINEFKDAARKLLCNCPGRMSEVISAAHRFQDQDGGAKLIRICYEVRSLMHRVPREKREQFLKRAFRSVNPVVCIPE